MNKEGYNRWDSMIFLMIHNIFWILIFSMDATELTETDVRQGATASDQIETSHGVMSQSKFRSTARAALQGHISRFNFGALRARPYRAVYRASNSQFSSKTRAAPQGRTPRFGK